MYSMTKQETRDIVQSKTIFSYRMPYLLFPGRFVSQVAALESVKGHIRHIVVAAYRITLACAVKKVKVAHTLLPSVGFLS